MLLLGVLIISSASALMSQMRFGDSYVYLRHQVLLGILPGLILGLVTYLVPLNFFERGRCFLWRGRLYYR